MPLDPTTALRAYAPHDDTAVVALYDRVHAAEPSFDVPGLDRWRAWLTAGPAREGRDFRVVEHEAGVVALLTSMWLDDPRVEGGVRQIRVVVDPGFRRRGLGDALLREAIAQARSEGTRALQGSVDGSWRAARAFCAARGFDVFVRNVFLRRDATPLAAPALPPGVRLRGYEGPDDARAWAAVYNATLVRDREFSRESPEAAARYATNADAELLFAVADAPVGVCHVEARGEKGFVHSLGVLAAWEGRGVGAALLARGVEALRARGVARVVLCTEADNDRAQRLYARSGFVFDHDNCTMRRPLDPAPRPG